MILWYDSIRCCWKALRLPGYTSCLTHLPPLQPVDTSIDFEAWDSSTVSDPQWADAPHPSCSPVWSMALQLTHIGKGSVKAQLHVCTTHKNSNAERLDNLATYHPTCCNAAVTRFCCRFVQGCSCTDLLDWVQQRPHLRRGLWKCYHSLLVTCWSYIIDITIFPLLWITV